MLTALLLMAIPTKPAAVSILPRPVVALFNLPPAEIRRDDITSLVWHLGLAVKMQALWAWHAPSFEACRDYFNARTLPEIEWIAKHTKGGYIAEGDNFCGDAGARAWLDGSSWAPSMVHHVAAALKDRCHAFHVVDESSQRLPSVWKPDRLVVPWRAAGGPSMAWPALVNPSPLERPEHSGHTYRQMDWWKRRTLPQLIQGIRHCCRKAPAGRPLATIVCAIERKEQVDGTGNVYLSYAGIQPGWIKAQTWAAMACHASIVEVWGYDCHAWRQARESPQPGAMLHTGIRPGSPCWGDFQDACYSVMQRGDDLAGKPFEPIWDGRKLTGRRGRLAWTVDSKTAEVQFRRAA